MTDVHTHIASNDASLIEYLANRDFFGTHPWDALTYNEEKLLADLESNPHAWVGEIGLDRLRDKQISDESRRVFVAQLTVASRMKRPVTLHGAKCWGEVVKTIGQVCSKMPCPPSFLFHGFSRSDGLLADIAQLNGFISVGPQVMNEHAVNYRKLVVKIPDSMLLFETDRTAENQECLPTISQIISKTAEIRRISVKELEKLTDENARRFAQIYV